MEKPVAPRRTYGRRSKPLTLGRKAAMGRLAEYEIQLEGMAAGTLDPNIFFPSGLAGKNKTVHLEIGCGTGEHVAAIAAANPDDLFLAAEPYTTGVASLLKTVQENHLQNVRIYPDDGLALLTALRAGGIAHAYLLFSDPWPKQRHHTRRFIQPETVAEFARILRPGGTLLLASDDKPLVNWMLKHMQACAAFSPLPPPENPIPTRYAQKAMAAGKPLFYLPFRRQP